MLEFNQVETSLSTEHIVLGCVTTSVLVLSVLIQLTIDSQLKTSGDARTGMHLIIKSFYYWHKC